MKLLEMWARKHLVKSVPDPVLREKLTPNFLIGCKRALLSNDYLSSFCRPNVELVTDGIAQVREHSIVTADGNERPVDALIYATGFRTTDLLSPVRFVGRGGVALDDAWLEGLEAFWGVTVAGYPNLFFLIGPNSRVGHSSIVFMIEAQVHYVMQCLRLMHKKQATVMDVRPEAQAQFNRSLQERMKRTVYASGCKSWYLDARGKNVILWPWFTCQYWMRTRRVKASDYVFTTDSVIELVPS
jgi:cation diffusion facilitator CzcD-associated flavoprotein CzcO